MADSSVNVNETQTIFRAQSDPILTLHDNQTEGEDPDVAVRKSIVMKKPSMDFNAEGPGFMHKIKSKTQANDQDQAAKQSGKKGAGKMLWSMASSLRKMVVNRFTAGKQQQSEANLTAGALQEDNGRGQASHREKAVKFENFEDQLKQIRLSREYLQDNPHIAQQVIINEAKKDSKADNQIFQIGEDDGDLDEFSNPSDQALQIKGNARTAIELQEESKTGLMMIDTTGSSQSQTHAQELDLWQGNSVDQDDMAVARAACAPFMGGTGEHDEIAFDSPRVIEEEGQEDVERRPFKLKEKSGGAYHRLPFVGQMSVMEQLETYFKVEITIPVKQLREEEAKMNPKEAAEAAAREEAEAAAPKKKGLLSKMWGLANVLSGKKASSQEKQRQREKAEETTFVLATRFLSFNEGCLVILQYLPHKPQRDYATFSEGPTHDRSRPIPEVVWDAQTVEAQRLNSMKEIHLLNYRVIAECDEPEETLVSVALMFAEVNHDYVAITDQGNIRPFDTDRREGYQAYRKATSICFMIEFDDIEDFINEIRQQLNDNNCNTCNLIIS